MTKISNISKIAAPVVAALGAVKKADVKVGDTVIKAAANMSEADIKPFCDVIQPSLEKLGYTVNSAKVTTMYIRRVLTAIIVDGVEVENGQTLRGLYDALPKKKTGGSTHAPRLPNPANDTGSEESADAEAPTTLESRAEKVRAAVTMIFGYSEPALLDAVQFAAANTADFIRWAENASALGEAEKAIISNMEQSTPAKKTTRKKREAVTA